MALMDLPSYDRWDIALAPLAGWPEAATPSRSMGVLKRMASRFLAWRAQRETVRLLHSVDAATLRDLGITDIDSVVYGAPEGHKRHYDPDWWKRTRSPA
jgi:uncharacterized protein YjiS (DUF1127 family)